jgi:hypothetical protein
VQLHRQILQTLAFPDSREFLRSNLSFEPPTTRVCYRISIYSHLQLVCSTNRFQVPSSRQFPASPSSVGAEPNYGDAQEQNRQLPYDYRRNYSNPELHTSGPHINWFGDPQKGQWGRRISSVVASRPKIVIPEMRLVQVAQRQAILHSLGRLPGVGVTAQARLRAPSSTPQDTRGGTIGIS